MFDHFHFVFQAYYIRFDSIRFKTNPFYGSVCNSNQEFWLPGILFSSCIILERSKTKEMGKYGFILQL